MRIRDWIEAKQGEKPDRERWCASVKQDTNGDFYSYGSHYPLLVQVAGMWVCNNVGWSNTTGKHIGHAQPLADFVIAFHDDGQGGYGASYGNSWGYKSDIEKLDLLIGWLTADCNRLGLQMAEKKRKDTQVYEGLSRQYTIQLLSKLFGNIATVAV